jgi:Domain of unknown function (DUF397)
MTWRKSSYSANDTDCVEVDLTLEVVAVRDSKNVDGPILSFTPDQWRVFLRSTPHE